MENIQFIPNIVNSNIRLFIDESLNKIVELIEIYYKSDDIVVQGYILQKKKLNKIVPVIIGLRGGNRDFGEFTPKSIQYFLELFEYASSEKGIIFFPNYRGSSKSKGLDQFGGLDVNDIIALYPIIKQHKYCDDNRIALYGWSRGGMMTIIVATKVNWIKTIILGGSIYSLTRWCRERPKMAKMLRDEFNLTNSDFKLRSGKYLMDQIPKNISFLILHGNLDDRVSVTHAYSLGKKCQKYNLLYKLIIFPNGDHGLTQYRDNVAIEVIKWLDNYL